MIMSHRMQPAGAESRVGFVLQAEHEAFDQRQTTRLATGVAAEIGNRSAGPRLQQLLPQPRAVEFTRLINGRSWWRRGE